MPFVPGRRSLPAPSQTEPRFYSDADYDYGSWTPSAGYQPSAGPADLAVRTLAAEARGEGPEGMAAVAGVIKNRSDWTGKDLQSVVQEPHQFEPWQNPRTRQWMLGLPRESPEYQAAAAAGLPIFSGQAPDPTGGATAFYSPRSQAGQGRSKPAFDDGSGVPVGNQLYFQGDYRRTHRRGQPVHLGLQYRFPPTSPAMGLFDAASFPVRKAQLKPPTEAWPVDGSAGPRPPRR